MCSFSLMASLEAVCVAAELYWIILQGVFSWHEQGGQNIRNSSQLSDSRRQRCPAERRQICSSFIYFNSHPPRTCWLLGWTAGDSWTLWLRVSTFFSMSFCTTLKALFIRSFTSKSSSRRHLLGFFTPSLLWCSLCDQIQSYCQLQRGWHCFQLVSPCACVHVIIVCWLVTG